MIAVLNLRDGLKTIITEEISRAVSGVITVWLKTVKGNIYGFVPLLRGERGVLREVNHEPIQSLWQIQ